MNLKRETARISLNINSIKTKFMASGRNRGNKGKSSVGFQAGEFVYLGTLGTMTLPVKGEAHRRLTFFSDASKITTSSEYQGLFWNQLLSFQRANH